MEKCKSWITLFATAILGACAQQPSMTTKSEVILFPALPEQPRIQYLTTISSELSLDPTAKQSGFRDFVVGADAQRKVMRLHRPFALGSSAGALYVLDKKQKAVTRIDLKTGKFDFLDDLRGGLPEDPISIFTDTDGRTYVADAGRQDIMVYNERGEFETSYATGDRSRPVDVVASRDFLYVVEMNESVILILDKLTGELVDKFGGPGTTDGLLNKPTHLARTTDGRIAVTDQFNYRIQLFDAEGNYLDQYGQQGQGRGAVVRPKGISIDHSDNLYLADIAFEFITIFHLETGTPRMTFAKSGLPGGSYMPQDVLIDYDNVEVFRKYAHPYMELEYIIYVANSYNAISVYGFGNWTGSLDPNSIREMKGSEKVPATSTIKSLEEIQELGEPEP